jgi:hypothetical protein
LITEWLAYNVGQPFEKSQLQSTKW